MVKDKLGRSGEVIGYMKIIAKYSDYALQSIEFFISQIKDDIELRDIKGLTNNKIQKINVTKEHPLVQFVAAQINPNVNLENLRSNIIPAISVTPGNMGEEGRGFALSPQTFIIDDDWITELRELSNSTMRDIQSQGLITKDQITAIISQYNRNQGIMRVIKKSWGWNEEINISCWSDSPDIDTLTSTLVDSILAEITTGFMGDESPVKNMKYRATRGLTNFNFGRVLYGTEYNLTFFNTYHNYTVYQEDYVTGHDLNGTFKTPGSDEEWQMPTE